MINVNSCHISVSIHVYAEVGDGGSDTCTRLSIYIYIWSY